MARRTGNEALHTRVRQGRKLQREQSRAARKAQTLVELDDESSDPECAEALARACAGEEQ